MKKILTIAATATAGLISAFTGSVYAQTTTLSGLVPSSCVVTTPTTSTLAAAPAVGPATSLAGSYTATVVCNDTSKTVNVATATTGNTLLGGTAAAAFVSGTGTLAGASGASKALTAVTPLAGDTAVVNASITAPTGQLLSTGTGVLVVNTTITP
jgi:hypothetical protein